jgi:hypothetical protein
MPHSDHEPCLILRELDCRQCGQRFFLCPGCYCGQRYCRPECRGLARRRQMRAANRRHQQSEYGRLDHNDRQSAYRERCRQRVTDQSFPAPDLASSSGYDVVPPPPPPPAPVCGGIRAAPPGGLRCSICGRAGLPFRFSGLWLRLARLWPASAPYSWRLW